MMYDARARPFLLLIKPFVAQRRPLVKLTISYILDHSQSHVTHQTVHQDQMAAGLALGRGTLSAGTCALLQDNDQQTFLPKIRDSFLRRTITKHCFENTSLFGQS